MPQATEAEKAYARAYYMKRATEDPTYRQRQTAKKMETYYARRAALLSDPNYAAPRLGRPLKYPPTIAEA